jgi:hypothetical protein
MGLNNGVRPKADSDVIHAESCLICAGLRGFQTDCVENLRARSPMSLCNVHTWLIAKSAEAGAAADVLLRMLEHALKDNSAGAPCDLCTWMAQQENQLLEEFSKRLQKSTHSDWFREHGGLCVPHTWKLLDRTPDALHGEIILTVQKRAAELRRRLASLSRDAKSGLETRPGLLGQAAEYLVTKRGLTFNP